jgi:hypothetical protein
LHHSAAADQQVALVGDRATPQRRVVEGRWSTGAGLTTAEAGRAVLRHRSDVTITALDDPALWGSPVTDERYLLVSRR